MPKSTKKRKKRDRTHEQVCTCSAYRFPHRMFGGKCDGSHLASEGYGSPECSTCTLNDRGYCEVMAEQEKSTGCALVLSYIDYHEIKLWNPRLERKKR